MKRALPIFLLLFVLVGGVVYWKQHGMPASKPAAEEKPEEEKSRVSHDDQDRVIIKMDDEAQGNIGLLVAKPKAIQLNPEVKGYGKVLDPALLVTQLSELASAQAGQVVSRREFERLKTLAGQGNASDRALQAAEAAAFHDQLAFRTARDHLSLSWSRELTARNDLAAVVESLASRDSVLVRIDLPAGEALTGPPAGARIYNLSGGSAEAEFAGDASNVDPQTLGRGYLFLLKQNSLRLLPGEAVTGYIKIPGSPIEGIFIQSESVVRTEGAGWVYVLNKGGDQFTRMGVSLDRPVDAGWFVTTGVSTNEYVVTTGAQILLSEELKASLKPE